MTTQKTRETGDLKSQLIEAASEIISKEGFKKLTIRTLSSRVGVSRTALYRHFANKDALLFAIAERGFEELTDRYRRVNRDESRDAVSRFRGVGLAYVEFAIRNPGAFRLMFGQEIAQHTRSPRLCSRAQETFREYLSALEAVREEQDTTGGDSSILANYYWSAVHGLAVLLLDGQIRAEGADRGVPTLLTEGRACVPGNAEALIAYSEEVLDSLWALRGFGLQSEEERGRR